MQSFFKKGFEISNSFTFNTIVSVDGIVRSRYDLHLSSFKSWISGSFDRRRNQC